MSLLSPSLSVTGVFSLCEPGTFRSNPTNGATEDTDLNNKQTIVLSAAGVQITNRSVPETDLQVVFERSQLRPSVISFLHFCSRQSWRKIVSYFPFCLVFGLLGARCFPLFENVAEVSNGE